MRREQEPSVRAPCDRCGIWLGEVHCSYAWLCLNCLAEPDGENWTPDNTRLVHRRILEYLAAKLQILELEKALQASHSNRGEKR